MAQKPLMLKDFLALDWNSESSEAGLIYSTPPWGANDATVRCLVDAQLRGGGRRRLVRTRSTSALTKMFAVINAISLLPFATASSSDLGGGHRTGQEWFVSSSFSKKLRGSFSKKRVKAVDGEQAEKNMLRVKDIVRLRSFQDEVKETGDEQSSFDFPSPVVSSCSESETFGSNFPSSIAISNAGEYKNKQDSPRASPIDRTNGTRIAVEDAEAGHHRTPTKASEIHGIGKEIEESQECQAEEGEEEEEEEEKQQLSPVSVMDFPSDQEEDEEEDEEADDTASPNSFHHSLAKLERTKLQLLQKIRRFERLADLDPLDIDRSSAYSDELFESTDPMASSDADEEDNDDKEEEDDEGAREKKARGLLGELKGTSHVGWHEGIEKILVDFFVQGLSCSDAANGDRRYQWRNTGGGSMAHHELAEEERMLRSARDWIEGARRRELDEDLREVALTEMEGSRRQRLLEEEEMGAELAGLVMSSLVEELVVDLVSR